MDLLDDLPLLPEETRIAMAAGAVLLRGFARADAAMLLQALEDIVAQAPLRHLQTPGGTTMSVAMTNCGPLGWVSDTNGYRYSPHDPQTGQPWPAMPACLQTLARRAADEAGYPGFAPDACLINQYVPGAKLSHHQDKDERDLRAPIVSVSLGLPAIFRFGSPRRKDPSQRYRLVHGDVVVWGGPSRLAYHSVLPLADAEHPLLGRQRINLTFRQAR